MNSFLYFILIVLALGLVILSAAFAAGGAAADVSLTSKLLSMEWMR